ncbi:MAG: LemA family protein [Candidatus Omnitrophica bacterium]|nr:LemA family protein [Candidatus Omnitrophota bacterium]MBU2043687.1 LemA family protein [Candidatus Omnitrophota bacterium]MBU2265736.1 LemA family protein [Candidatus Omnitrophota bacterium]MBU2474167.1 LemA family protein [Candidatus Omnitrophota bacterium]
MLTGLAILLVLAVMAVLVVIGIYNGIIALRNSVDNAWAQIDVQLKRRHDLIPNLVNVAKGYLVHEKETLENVIKARTQATQATAVKDKQAAENMLTSSLRSLFAVVEQYPDLKANQNLLKLHEEITSTENRIAFARQFYNDEVMRHNTLIQKFPNNVIAGSFNFGNKELFEIDDPSHKEVPEVKL